VTTLHGRLRTSDVARRSGWSVQQVRDLEAEGVLPAAGRAANGYRTWDERHVRAATAYRHLSAAVGPVRAAGLLRTGHADAGVQAVRLLDAAHADLHRQRLALAAAVRAAAVTASEPVGDAVPSDAMTTAELARALGVRASALRHWHAEGLVEPERGPRGARTWTPEQVRTTRVVHQLRLAGYGISALREVVPQLAGPGDQDRLREVLQAREAELDRRSRALLRAGAALDGLLDAVPDEGSW
jgi:DNA-binding transcriptional MerR regulator